MSLFGWLRRRGRREFRTPPTPRPRRPPYGYQGDPGPLGIYPPAPEVRQREESACTPVPEPSTDTGTPADSAPSSSDGGTSSGWSDSSSSGYDSGGSSGW